MESEIGTQISLTATIFVCNRLLHKQKSYLSILEIIIFGREPYAFSAGIIYNECMLSLLFY